MAINTFEPVIIGVDGGGSRTRGILYRGEVCLAQAETGTARVGNVGVVESSERLLNLVRDLLRMGGMEGEHIDAVTIGLAGVWLAEEQQRSKQLITLFAKERKIDIGTLTVASDAAIALEGALNGKPGIVLIVGTGTIAIGKTPEGEIVRCGGWGIELSDEGSGAWIGREGLTAIVRSFDGRGKKTMLADLLIKFFPAINPRQPRTIVAAYNEKMFDYPSVAPFVMECAQHDDEVCLDIIRRGTAHLMEMVTVLRNQHFGAMDVVEIACVGGIMESDTIVARQMTQALGEAKGVRKIKPVASPLLGAVSLGKKLIRSEMEL